MNERTKSENEILEPVRHEIREKVSCGSDLLRRRLVFDLVTMVFFDEKQEKKFRSFSSEGWVSSTAKLRVVFDTFTASRIHSMR